MNSLQHDSCCGRDRKERLQWGKRQKIGKEWELLKKNRELESRE
jgi:hypothetical protein